jgi:hypothetical protein
MGLIQPQNLLQQIFRKSKCQVDFIPDIAGQTRNKEHQRDKNLAPGTLRKTWAT